MRKLVAGIKMLLEKDAHVHITIVSIGYNGLSEMRRLAVVLLSYYFSSSHKKQRRCRVVSTCSV